MPDEPLSSLKSLIQCQCVSLVLHAGCLMLLSECREAEFRLYCTFVCECCHLFIFICVGEMVQNKFSFFRC